MCAGHSPVSSYMYSDALFACDSSAFCSFFVVVVYFVTNIPVIDFML